MRPTLHRWIRAISLAACWAAHDLAAAAVEPGARLDRTTWQQAQGMLPDVLLRQYADGKLASPVGKISTTYALDDSFLAASAANKGRFRLDENGSLVEVATGRMPERSFGAPFPEIDPSDPQAALEIIWNYEYAYWSNGSNKQSPTLFWFSAGSRQPERQVSIVSEALIYEGSRHAVDNPQQFSRLDRTLLTEPADLHGTASLGWRYKEPTRRDSQWAYVPALRRVRAVSPANRSDGSFGSEMTQDDGFNGFDAKPEDFTYKLLGASQQYVPFVAEALYGRIPLFRAADAQGWGVETPDLAYGYKDPAWAGLPWSTPAVQVARPTWLIEAVPKDRYYLFGKLLLTIDRETYKLATVIKYDWKGEPSTVTTRALSYAEAPDGYRYVNLAGGGQGGAYAENLRYARATLAGVPLRAEDNVIDAKLDSASFQPDNLVRLGR